MYELRHLRAFLAVAEALHFGRAAERIGLSQPALSRTIAELEEALSVTLFRRTTRQVSLTAAGEAFMEATRETFAQLRRAETAAQDAAAGTTGLLRIAYNDFAINGRLPELIRVFVERHPDIRLELTYLATTLQRKALLTESIDVGFLIGGLESEGFANYPFHEDRYVALLPATHAMASRRELYLTDLADEPFVMGTVDQWGAHRERTFALCQSAGFFPKVVQEAGSSEGIFGLVAAGTGVTIYAECVRNLQRRGLVIKPLSDVTAVTPTIAVWRRGNRAATLARFVECLQNVWGRSSP
ncbi:LysR family transcriptional regulator [Acuticoccus sediminis]|uniref:LysR family transcriptional regulator n=1 Tax=Acuticoccus sediminis TaxID=2184697 RepID=A0A8B2NXD4_9HYPH|nr:LysR family transcriptional regulator [Acuticoccus sediminis]RAI02012.1 LysR family transcriptional regulator [Acuticoccus sediminis]